MIVHVFAEYFRIYFLVSQSLGTETGRLFRPLDGTSLDSRLTCVVPKVVALTALSPGTSSESSEKSLSWWGQLHSG